MILLTVGTEYPFDRLVRAIDEIITELPLNERIFAQIGQSSYKPRNMEWVNKMRKCDFDMIMVKSKAIISHAGVGTIEMALELQKPLLVMPRLKRFGEHVNDHQVAAARKFAASGHILAAYSHQELISQIKALHTFSPKSRNINIDVVVNFIKKFLDSIGKNGEIQ